MSGALLHWLMLGVYAVGWALAIPGALQRRMLQRVCPRHWDTVCEHSQHSSDQFVARGSLRERNGGDVGTAIFRAAFWPVRLLIRLIVGVFTVWGHGMKFLVFSATSLTEPERDRIAAEQAARIAEQAAEIKRLSEQIEGASS